MRPVFKPLRKIHSAVRGKPEYSLTQVSVFWEFWRRGDTGFCKQSGDAWIRSDWMPCAEGFTRLRSGKAGGLGLPLHPLSSS